PGQPTSRAPMRGIDANEQRPRMDEALEAIMALLAYDEPVTMKTDWFTLQDARLQLRPYTHPCFDIAVAASISPAGPRAAGRYGLGLLSVAATNESGFGVVGTPDMAVDQIQRLVEQSKGGFGAFLLFGHEWADREATLKSYELFARYVMPAFNGQMAPPAASCEWVTGSGGEFVN